MEQKGEGPEFVSCPGMGKTEGLGIAWDMNWHVALNKQRSGCSDQEGNTPCGTKYQLPVATCSCRMCVHVDAKEILYFLFWSSALQNRQRPLDPIE